MMDENLVHSFWTSQPFLDACERWEVDEGDAGILVFRSQRFFLEYILL